MKKLISKTKKGFTLVELIVVIAIIAILAAVTAVSYVGFVNNARLSAAQTEAKQYQTVLVANASLNQEVKVTYPATAGTTTPTTRTTTTTYTATMSYSTAGIKLTYTTTDPAVTNIDANIEAKLVACTLAKAINDSESTTLKAYTYAIDGTEEVSPIAPGLFLTKDSLSVSNSVVTVTSFGYVSKDNIKVEIGITTTDITNLTGVLTADLTFGNAN